MPCGQARLRDLMAVPVVLARNRGQCEQAPVARVKIQHDRNFSSNLSINPC